MRRRKKMALKEKKLKDVYQEFLLEHRAKNTSKKTLATYAIHLDSFFKLAQCDELPSAFVDKSFYLYYIEALQEEGTKRDTTIASYCRSVRAFFYWCMDNGYMESDKLDIPKYDKTIKQVYSDSEIAKLLEQPPKGCSEVTYQTWVFINLIMSTGLRVSSALDLRVSDFVKKENLLYIQHTKQRTGQQIYLNAEMSSILSKYIKAFDLEDEDYIFCIATKARMALRTMQDNVATYNKSRGVQKTSIHLMRHTFAKNYYTQTKDIYSLQQMLGHSMISTTEHYIKGLGLSVSNSTAYNPQAMFSSQKTSSNQKRRKRTM